jgi:hypothetical protein
MGWMPISPWRALPGVAGQNLTIGVASVQSAAFQAETRAVQISALGGNCHVRTGANPTAVGTDMLVKATDPPLVLAIGNGELLAMIQDASSTGTLNVIEVSH